MKRWSGLDQWAQIATILGLPVAILAIIITIILAREESTLLPGMVDTDRSDNPAQWEISDLPSSLVSSTIPTRLPTMPTKSPTTPRKLPELPANLQPDLGPTEARSLRLVYQDEQLTLQPPYCSNYFVDFDEPLVGSNVENSEIEFLEVDCGLAPSPYIILSSDTVAGTVADHPTSHPTLEDCRRVLNAAPRSNLEPIGNGGTEVCFITSKGRIASASFRFAHNGEVTLTLTVWEQVT